MIDLHKYTDLSGKLPVLNVTPEQLGTITWHSIPAMVTGVLLATFLIWLRGVVLRVHQARSGSLPLWLDWGLYAVRHVAVWYLVVVGVATAVAAMPVSGELKGVVGQFYGVLSIVQIGLVLSGLFTDACRTYLKRSHADGARILMVNTIITVGKIVIWVLMFVTALNTVGVNVTGMVAGLGIGGIALAFATKNIVENVLASFTMVLNPPFVIGDWIETDTVAGRVEEITLKNVLLRGTCGEQWIIPSGALMNSRIRNMSRMHERRVEVKFGIGYATLTPDRLEGIPRMVRSAVEGAGGSVRFDRAHITGFGDNLVNVEAVFFITSADFAAFMDLRQAILFRIYRALHEAGIFMALGFRVGNAHDLAGVQDMLGLAPKPDRARSSSRQKR